MKFATGMVRLSYPHIFETHEDMNGTPKYSASLIIPKKDKKQVDRINEVLADMLQDKEIIAKLGGKAKGIDLPLRDGDETRADDAAYADCYYINAKANADHRPQVLLFDRTECVDREEVYAGCWVQAVIEFFPYNKNGKKGISAGLKAIRKVKDGEPLTSSRVTDSDWNDDLLPDDVSADELI